GYSHPADRQSDLNGLLTRTNLPNPPLGSHGNERTNAFRNTGFAGTDADLSKDTAITEKVRLQLRFEVYNLFNRVNLGLVDTELTSTTFGRSTSQFNARWIQLGARLSF